MMPALVPRFLVGAVDLALVHLTVLLNPVRCSVAAGHHRLFSATQRAHTSELSMFSHIFLREKIWYSLQTVVENRWWFSTTY